MKTTLRQYGKKALVFCLSFCVALALCEIALRIIDYTYTPLSIEFRGGVHDYRRQHALDEKNFVHDPKLLWRPKGKNLTFNSQGFRGRILLDNKPKNEFRIFALGDSNTLGWEKPHRAHWPGCLYKLLAVEDDRFEVANAGVYGYSSYQGLQRLEEILAYRPDMMLISFGANDAQKVVVPDAEFRAGVFRSAVFRTRIGHLVIAAWDQFVAYRRNPEHRGPVPRVSLPQYKANLKEIIRICKENGIQCVLLTRPFVGPPHDGMDWRAAAPDYVAATIEVGKNQNVPVIDLHAHFADEDKEDYFVDNSHFTDEFHELAAKIILEKIRPMLPK